MYRELGGGDIVRSTAPPGLTVVAARRDDTEGPHLGVWVTNATDEAYETALAVDQFPAGPVQVQVFDNLAGDTPIDTLTAEGEDLAVNVTVPSQCSYTFVFGPLSGGPNALWLPTIVVERE
jgi:hypothetical protein